jgi:hypothetical protein
MCTDGGTRTRTTPSDQRILSPLRLPFRHIGFCQQVRIARTFSKRKRWLFDTQLESDQTAGSFSVTGCVVRFVTGTPRSVLIPPDFRLAAWPF